MLAHVLLVSALMRQLTMEHEYVSDLQQMGLTYAIDEVGTVDESSKGGGHIG